MPPVPEPLFHSLLDQVVRNNADYIPPYGSDGSLYMRPVYFGHGAQLGLGVAPEYTFCVVSNPVGKYYKTGVKPVDAIILQGYDRAGKEGCLCLVVCTLILYLLFAL